MSAKWAKTADFHPFRSTLKMIPAIATVYSGVQYRSRLEARWAAFFDLLGWPFQYEPFDLAGWIPDFVLLGHDKVLVEVKPVTAFPRETAEEIDRAIPGVDSMSEVESACDQEVVIVGCTITGIDHMPDDPIRLGWLRSETDWADAPMGVWCGDESTAKNPHRKIGFCHENQSYHDRITGCYDGGSWGTAEPDRILALWNQAGNLTQWKGKQSVTDARPSR